MGTIKDRHTKKVENSIWIFFTPDPGAWMRKNDEK
jgi:hypothetical protein